MTDWELLELAAKAAGLCYVWRPYGGHVESTTDGPRPWNPLTDDGDALRLAVKLGLNVDVYRRDQLRETPAVEVCGYVYRRSLAVELAVDNGTWLESATRRAIVRAAGEIGKGM